MVEKQLYPENICCDSMERHLKYGECEQHGSLCPDKVVHFNEDGWVLIGRNGGYHLKYCPWCGTLLN